MLRVTFVWNSNVINWELDYGKIEQYWVLLVVLSFLSLPNIILLFPLYARCSSTILKFIQDFLKLTLFPSSFDISFHFSSFDISFHFFQIIVFTLREKCPNTEFFLVRIFPHLDWIWRDTEYLSVFSPTSGKYGPQKTPHLDTFHAVSLFAIFLKFIFS